MKNVMKNPHCRESTILRLMGFLESWCCDFMEHKRRNYWSGVRVPSRVSIPQTDGFNVITLLMLPKFYRNVFALI